MQGWLAGFAQLGLLDWDPGSPTCHVRRDPLAEEIEACRRRVALPFERTDGEPADELEEEVHHGDPVRA
jgi:hypothetical protein